MKGGVEGWERGVVLKEERSMSRTSPTPDEEMESYPEGL